MIVSYNLAISVERTAKSYLLRSLFNVMSDLLSKLQKSKLIATCPNCQGEFLLSKTILFDGTKQFPPKAEEKKLTLTEELNEQNQEIKDRLDALKKLKISVDKTSEARAISTGLGKVMQNVLPYYKDFDSQVSLADCRFIAAQLDIIVFDGASNNHIKNITFMDAKTGAAKLEKNQRQIRDAVNDGKVRLELF